MNYVMRAPEINSLLIYSGAGSGPMLQASAAWAGLSDELGAAAQSFRSSIANLVSARGGVRRGRWRRRFQRWLLQLG